MVPTLPVLSIRLRDKEKYPAFEGLVSTVVGLKDGCVYVRCDSKDGLVALILGLNFFSERIEFNTQGGVAVGDPASAGPPSPAPAGEGTRTDPVKYRQPTGKSSALA